MDGAKDEEETLRAEQRAQVIDELAHGGGGATAAASDVTLTSDVADQQLPTEHQTSSCTETTRTCTTSPSSQPATVYIDIIRPIPVCQENTEATSKLHGDKTDQKETAEEQETHEDENLKDDTVDLGITNTETSQLLETPQPENMSESELESDEKEGVELTMEEIMWANVDVDLDTEVERIEVPESEDDDRDSSSVFNTCDESVQNSGRVSDRAASLHPALNEDSDDCIALLTEPDDTDKPPMAPRSTGPRRQQLRPVPAATLEYSCGDIPKLGDDRKSAKVCFGRARAVDRRAGDRPVSYHGVAISCTQPPRPSKRRPQSAVSPPLGGRITQHAGLAPPVSKALPRATHAPAASSHISASRHSDSPATKSTASLQSHQKARTTKPINMGRKPAWK